MLFVLFFGTLSSPTLRDFIFISLFELYTDYSIEIDV